MMFGKKFQRKVEDFTCEHCGTLVRGSGYTNHCPECLWSKHVDVNPGDRNEQCGGMMRPISIEKRGENYFINQRCERCGFGRKNSFHAGDNFNVLLELAQNL